MPTKSLAPNKKYNEQILEYGYICNADIYTTIEKHEMTDAEGYKYLASLDILKFSRNPNMRVSRYHTGNPFTMYNIKKYTSERHSHIRVLNNQTYKGHTAPIYVQCSYHGIIKTKWSNLYSKRGVCMECGIIKGLEIVHGRRKPLADTIRDFRKVHGDRYGYEYVEQDLTNAQSKIRIVCAEDGIFTQTPNTHLGGAGCPTCADRYNTGTGWSLSTWADSATKSSNFTGFKVYIIKCFNESESFYKCGITYTDINYRFKTKIMMPYNWEVIDIINFNEDSKSAWEYEKHIHKENLEHRYTPKLKFGGYLRECFSERLSFSSIS